MVVDTVLGSNDANIIKAKEILVLQLMLLTVFYSNFGALNSF